MKDKKMLIILLVLIFIYIVLIICTYFLKNLKTYELNLPRQEMVKSIAIESNEKKEIIANNEEIQNIIYILNGKNNTRTTQKPSINDSPVNADNIIKVEFEINESTTSTIFVYMKDNGYYIEKPYNGIYKIDKEEYDLIRKYVK